MWFISIYRITTAYTGAHLQRVSCTKFSPIGNSLIQLISAKKPPLSRRSNLVRVSEASSGCFGRLFQYRPWTPTLTWHLDLLDSRFWILLHVWRYWSQFQSKPWLLAVLREPLLFDRMLALKVVRKHYRKGLYAIKLINYWPLQVYFKPANRCSYWIHTRFINKIYHANWLCLRLQRITSKTGVGQPQQPWNDVEVWIFCFFKRNFSSVPAFSYIEPEFSFKN